MTRPPTSPVATARGPMPAIFAGLFGALLGLCILKFGNPVILDKLVTWPTNIYEWIFSSWPVVIARWLLAIVICAALPLARWKTGKIPLWLLALPVAWLLWQCVSATQTINEPLSQITVIHFTCCVVCFYIGFFVLSVVRELGSFWIVLLAAFLVVLFVGFQQHFGGLKETLRYLYVYDFPDPNHPPPADLIKRMSTNRIFSTLLYPNTLAGVILLLLPALLAMVYSAQGQFTLGARRFMVVVIVTAALACLFWSGSKGGWLLMLAIGLVGVLIRPMKRQLKLTIIAAVIVLGLAGFALKYAGYFKRGATSATARFDYWRAAAQITKEKPVFGTGPGTFVRSYERVKKPESEMARLTHNDYLQQACDSGIPGALLYLTFVAGVMVYTFCYGKLNSDWVRLAVWLGLLGWALQSTIEFGLYIPAIAWPAFGLMGWLLGHSSNQIDTQPAVR